MTHGPFSDWKTVSVIGTCFQSGIRQRKARDGMLCPRYSQPLILLHLRTLGIGVGRFRILGGPRFRILEGQGGPNSQQAHDVVTTSMRRNDVASTSFRRHVLTRFLINQCQIITFLILKSDIMENSRIELREIVLPVPSNQIKVTSIIILPFNLVHL